MSERISNEQLVALETAIRATVRFGSIDGPLNSGSEQPVYISGYQIQALIDEVRDLRAERERVAELERQVKAACRLSATDPAKREHLVAAYLAYWDDIHKRLGEADDLRAQLAAALAAQQQAEGERDALDAQVGVMFMALDEAQDLLQHSDADREQPQHYQELMATIDRIRINPLAATRAHAEQVQAKDKALVAARSLLEGEKLAEWDYTIYGPGGMNIVRIRDVIGQIDAALASGEQGDA